MRARWYWLPLFLLGALVWAFAIIGIKAILDRREAAAGPAFPVAISLGDRYCLLRDFESATFELSGGSRVYVIRLPRAPRQIVTERND